MAKRRSGGEAPNAKGASVQRTSDQMRSGMSDTDFNLGVDLQVACRELIDRNVSMAEALKLCRAILLATTKGGKEAKKYAEIVDGWRTAADTEKKERAAEISRNAGKR